LPVIDLEVDQKWCRTRGDDWEAEMMARSEWQRRRGTPSRNITITGQGARVNIGSSDQSVQQFHDVQDDAAVVHLLEEIKTAVQQNLDRSAESKEAALDVDQLKIELQRSRPDKSLV
jgi:hypothetical protein